MNTHSFGSHGVQSCGDGVGKTAKGSVKAS